MKEWEPRFWAKVNKTETCWLWTGTASHGFGAIKINGRNRSVRIVAYELHHGPLGAERRVETQCGESRCVHPDHLSARRTVRGERRTQRYTRHGTEEGYARHLRLEEPPCVKCRQARLETRRLRELAHRVDSTVIQVANPTSEQWETAPCKTSGTPDAWFSTNQMITLKAKVVCRSCPFRTACLNLALADDEQWGVWGGLTERERAKLKRRAA